MSGIRIVLELLLGMFFNEKGLYLCYWLLGWHRIGCGAGPEQQLPPPPTTRQCLA